MGCPRRHQQDPRRGHDGPLCRRCAVRRRLRGARRFLARTAEWLPGLLRRGEARPHGQHLEPVSVHGHLQHEPLGQLLRERHGPRDGLPRFLPGPARLRAHDPRARPRAHPRHRGDAVPRRQRLPPVPAAHQEGQLRHRQRLQRRSALAHRGYRRLSARDRRLVHPRRAGGLRQQPEPGAAPARASAPQLHLYPDPPRSPRPAADRPRRLERLPEPQLLLRAPG